MTGNQRYWTVVALAVFAGWLIPTLDELRHWSWGIITAMVLPALIAIGWLLYRLRP